MQTKGSRRMLKSEMRSPVLLTLLFLGSLGAEMATGKEYGAEERTPALPASRQLQLFSLFDPLASLFRAQEQQEHSLMHMMSSHRATDSILEYSSSDPAGQDIAEAILEDQPQVRINDLSKSPQHARLHSRGRSQALAKSKSGSQPSDQGSGTSLTPAAQPVSHLTGRNGSKMLSNEESALAAPADCAALIEHGAVLSCLVSRLASLNDELEALSPDSHPQASIVGASPCLAAVLSLRSASHLWKLHKHAGDY